MKYRQLTLEDRCAISALRKQGYSPAEIARALGRHRSTITREVTRNSRQDGAYRAPHANELTRWRRSWSRRNAQFTEDHWEVVLPFLREWWSPKQIAGRLEQLGLLSISHETIYKYVWNDRRNGGSLYQCFRQRSKRLRKRYGRYDSRGRLAGKAHISERPPGAENRSRLGHFEADTVIGAGDKHCILTLVDRKSRYVLIGKMRSRTAAELNRAMLLLIRTAPVRVRTITVDNGTEFHSYKEVERETGVRFYFATPHHSWERGTSENTNGLIRQYLPKKSSMRHVNQAACERIATSLNDRPRERHNFLTPAEIYADHLAA